ncbi:MAG: ribonuclease HI [Sphingomonadales bacterium]|nr:ribonuclease HI [Sphingomonadales bacterium]
MAQITVYTDGSALGNPGPGGYAAILISGRHRKEISGGYRQTTNNRMEIMAAIAALQQIQGSAHEIELVSDSKYLTEPFNKRWVVGWINRKWKNVKNPDLWKQLLDLVEAHHMQWTWIKGHNQHPENERCDLLAKEAASKSELLEDQGYIESKEANMD